MWRRVKATSSLLRAMEADNQRPTWLANPALHRPPDVAVLLLKVPASNLNKVQLRWKVPLTRRRRRPNKKPQPPLACRLCAVCVLSCNLDLDCNPDVIMCLIPLLMQPFLFFPCDVLNFSTFSSKHSSTFVHILYLAVHSLYRALSRNCFSFCWTLVEFLANCFLWYLSVSLLHQVFCIPIRYYCAHWSNRCLLLDCCSLLCDLN